MSPEVNKIVLSWLNNNKCKNENHVFRWASNIAKKDLKCTCGKLYYKDVFNEN